MCILEAEYCIAMPVYGHRAIEKRETKQRGFHDVGAHTDLYYFGAAAQTHFLRWKNEKTPNMRYIFNALRLRC